MIRSTLEQLHAELPVLSAPADTDEGARAALRIVIDHALRRDSRPVIAEELLACPNCGGECRSAASPYCSPSCREQASFVRQLRRDIEKGFVFDPERQINLGQVLWQLLGGGYPRRVAMIVGKARERILARDEFRCTACGAPATTLDHIATACNRPINVRSVCEGCARTRHFGDHRLLERPEVKELLEMLAQRVANCPALRVCDNPETWDWRAFIRQRKLLLEPSGVAGAGGGGSQ
jgi:5-methylcytosine-specific restriction endonuclease McrA